MRNALPLSYFRNAQIICLRELLEIDESILSRQIPTSEGVQWEKIKWATKRGEVDNGKP